MAGRESEDVRRAYRAIAQVEMCERLAFCGTQILLLLYIASAPALSGVIGMQAVRQLLGAGDDPTALAVRIFAAFGVAVYLAPLGGAMVARRIGRRATVGLGCMLMATGHFTLMAERGLLIGLALLVIGAGGTIANRPSMIGNLYADDDSRRVQAFARYVAATNVGVVLAPLICGTLGEHYGWRWGFFSAGVVMSLGAVRWLWGWRWLDIAMHTPVREGRGPVARWAIGPVLGFLISFVVVIAVVNFAYSLVPIWAERAVDRTVSGWTLPVSWLLSLDGVASILGIAATTRLWGWLAARRREPDDRVKFMIGCLIVATAFAWLSIAARTAPTPLVAVLCFYIVLDLSAGWLEPPLASLIARVSGNNVMPMAVLKAGTAAAALLLGLLSGLYEPVGAVDFWALGALLALGAGAVAAVMMVVFRRLAVGRSIAGNADRAP